MTVIYNGRPSKKRMSPSYINYRFIDIGNDDYYYVSIWFNGDISDSSSDHYYGNTGLYDINRTNFDEFGNKITRG